MKQTATARNRNSDEPPPLVVEVQDAWAGAGVPDDDEIRDLLAYVASSVGGLEPGSGIVVRVVDEAEGRALNRRFRQVDRPTNVLAFPAGDATGLAGLPPQEEAPALGDLVLCGAVVEREAEAQGKAAADHWAHLLVHGMLHLLGYDHQSPEDAAVMENLETELLQGRGIADPYSGR